MRNLSMILLTLIVLLFIINVESSLSKNLLKIKPNVPQEIGNKLIIVEKVDGNKFKGILLLIYDDNKKLLFKNVVKAERGELIYKNYDRNHELTLYNVVSIKKESKRKLEILEMDKLTFDFIEK